MLSAEDEGVRGAITRAIAARGFAPSNDDLAAALGMSLLQFEESLERLQATKSLLLHPNSHKVWVAHPFALSPGSCWVKTQTRGYWANCLYCALGIAAALERDAVIHTRLGGESEAVEFEIRNGEVVRGAEHVFHLSTPVARWWDNVIYACASFQPFRSESDVNDWCDRHAMPFGHVMTIPELAAFARDWYGEYVNKPWHKRTAEEIRIVFERHGLVSPFWRIG
ncbi:MAG TPA: organomercurial lyase [Thermoanaerobaculia bacterium]|jgi:hypothetical protein|nr:organomercurial lyase [Thermoanaerobaculia bacterium]